MKRSYMRLLGVTLLEIMLVLAIAAMIIIMSIRYYQSASASQQANSALAQIQAITASADNVSMGTGTGYTGLSATTIGPLLPGGQTVGLTTPWGTLITITGGTATTYTVTLPATPPNICPLIRSKLIPNTHFQTVSACGAAAADLSYTYNAAT